MKKTISIVLVVGLAISANVSKADFILGEPVNLGPPINSSRHENAVSISADSLSIFITVFGRPGGSGSDDLWVSTRATTDDPWGEPVNLGTTVNTSVPDGYPSISADGLTLYFSAANRSGGRGGNDIWMTTRATTDEDWDRPVNLGDPVDSGGNEFSQCISADGLSLYFGAERFGGSGNLDLWVATRETTDDRWNEPVNLGSIVNSSSYEQTPSISADGNTLFFASGRAGGLGDSDLWITRRNASDGSWATPVNLGNAVNTSNAELSPSISSDGRTLYFSSNRPGGSGNRDLWQVSIEPILDLNNNLKVDLDDMHILIDHWGENYSLCDISPVPFGDGIVDIKDLNVLAEHLFTDYRLIAHWKLDETEGSIAHDSVGDHDGTINGSPFWQPNEGAIDGALLFDGIDDYIETPFVLNPANGSFSVFAWVFCWTPGQAIISQTGDFGETWLGINVSGGKLITEFCDVYFDPLESEAVITDIQWHHIGLVYDLDTFHRRLYVDGILVAEDTTAVAGNPSDGGFYIGTSKDLDSGSFFSGMLDDVRIYNAALSLEDIAALAQ
jgi:Tol biopolymer transport system component